jgi:hypothetical protein
MDKPITEPLPHSVQIVVADGIYVDRTALPPPLVARLIRLAAFQNPEVFRAQAMRLSTHGKPRIISCAEIHPRHIALPRGCLDETVDVLKSHSVAPQIEDRRESGGALDLQFVGELRAEQALAAGALLQHDFGVLAAATAFGKTVVAASLIATRGCSMLVLVHRRELLTQWVERLAAFLSVDRSEIGTIGGGRRRPTGAIDVAVIQSLVRRGVVSDEIAGYGHLVVEHRCARIPDTGSAYDADDSTPGRGSREYQSRYCSRRRRAQRCGGRGADPGASRAVIDRGEMSPGKI